MKILLPKHQHSRELNEYLQANPTTDFTIPLNFSGYINGNYPTVTTQTKQLPLGANDANVDCKVITITIEPKSFSNIAYLTSVDGDVIRLEDNMGAGKDVFAYVASSFKVINLDTGAQLRASSATSAYQSGSFSVALDEAGIRLIKISSEGADSDSPTFLQDAHFVVKELDSSTFEQIGNAQNLYTNASGTIEFKQELDRMKIYTFRELAQIICNTPHIPIYRIITLDSGIRTIVANMSYWLEHTTVTDSIF